MTEEMERRKMVLAMEYIARQVNDEEVFEAWLVDGVADGDLDYGEIDPSEVDEYYLEDGNFKELMDSFLDLMKDARRSGGLYCGGITTRKG